MKIIIITGQTATGKTKLALEYAKKYDGELINCDSRQIYKKLDIITGKDISINSKLKGQKSKLEFKSQNIINNFDIGYYSIYQLPVFTKASAGRPTTPPATLLWVGQSTTKNRQPRTENQQLETKLWLYDMVDPKQYFSSYDWVNCAIVVIKNIFKRGKTPIIVGGTYFYLYHLLYSVDSENIKPNWQLRNKLNGKSVSELQSILKSLSPQFINKLSQSELYNPQRLIRKIEILLSNKNIKINSFHIPKKIILSKKINQSVKIKYLALRYENVDNLKQAIKNRVEERLKNGAIKEVKKLLEEGYSETDPGLRTIGYNQIIKYLKGKLSKNQAIEKWINKEIQYAKRQYTFMKKDKNIFWYSI